MKLVTSEFEELFKKFPLYSQEHESDPIVVARLFDSNGSAVWYLTEYDPIDKIAFGYICGLGTDEFGYCSLDEIESIVPPFGKAIVRDTQFQQKRLSNCFKSG